VYLSHESFLRDKNVSRLIIYFPFIVVQKWGPLQRVIFDEAVNTSLKEICIEIQERYDIAFVEI